MKVKKILGCILTFAMLISVTACETAKDSTEKDNNSKSEDVKTEKKGEIPTAEDFKHETFTAEDGTSLSYWIYLPDEEKVPLMVWEHGGGETLEGVGEGGQLQSDDNGCFTWFANNRTTAVLTVQYPKNYGFSIRDNEQEYAQMKAYEQAKYELIQELITKGSVDEDRVYIAGVSSGGGAALDFIVNYPDLFAGAMVLSAKDTLVPMSLKYKLNYNFNDEELVLSDVDYADCYNQMENILRDVDLSKCAIYFAGAEYDPVCTSYTYRMAYEILEKKGYNVKLKLYSNEEAGTAVERHPAYKKALSDQDTIDWLYQQKK